MMQTLSKGDKILKVDGKDVTNDTVSSALVGSDVAGSMVLSIRKS